MFSVVFIVRDEARSLPEAIKSLGSVPEVVVCDTGSCDETVLIAKELGAKVVEFPWRRDFSAAREFAASHASHDWIVRFDADERLFVHPGGDPETWLSSAISRAASERASMICVQREHVKGFIHWFPRCYLRSAWAWKYPVHEILVSPSGVRLAVASADGALVIHRRDRRPRPYRQILSEAIAEYPSDPYLTYHLARACFDEGDFEACIPQCDRYLGTQGGYRWHRSEAYLLRARCHAAEARIPHALSDFEEAGTICGSRAEPYLEAAMLAATIGRHDLVKSYIERGETISLPQELQMFGALAVPYVIDRTAYEAETWLRLRAEILCAHG